MSKKGVTMPLTSYLSTEPKVVTVRNSNWSNIVDEEDAKTTIIVDLSALPTGPRGSVDVDLSSIPTEGPFVARVENLSFEADEEQLRRIFADLNPNATKILRDGNRSRGVGLVELPTREQLIEALKRTDKELFGRKIRVLVSRLTDLNQTPNQRNGFGSRPNRTGDERPEMDNQWKRVGRHSEDRFDERSQRNDFRKQNNSRNDYGYGYSRTKDNRVKDNEERNTPTEESTEQSVKERPRLQLQPRTKPIEETQLPSDSPLSVDQTSPNNSDENQHNESDAGSRVELTTNKTVAPTRSANASIFGTAKPVDTAAKELEIEKKLRDMQVNNDDQEEEKVQTSKPQYNRDNNYRPKRSNYNDNQSGRGNDSPQRQEYNSTRRYDNDNRKSQYNNSPRRNYDNNRRDGETNRGNYRNRQVNNQRRISDDDFITEPQTKNPSQNAFRKPMQTEDDSNKLQLSNKFGMLDDDNDESSPVED